MEEENTAVNFSVVLKIVVTHFPLLTSVVKPPRCALTGAKFPDWMS